MLAPAERRRAPDTVALALEVAAAAVAASGRDAAELPCVFASAHGDLGINDYMCSTLASDPKLLSPIKFHNSVHNAAVGYWTIGTGCMAASNSLSRLRKQLRRRPARSRGAVRGRPAAVLLAGFDVPAVGALASVTTSRDLLAVALVIAPARSERTVAAFDWSLASGAQQPRAAPALRRRARAGRPTRWPMRCRCSRRWRAARPSRCACRCRPRCRCNCGCEPQRALSCHDRPTPRQHDVVIMGGGLAGLTLALQLKQRFADIDVVVLERRAIRCRTRRTRWANPRSRSAPTTSTRCWACKPHMHGAQLRKFGFRFFFSEGRRDIDQVTEIGASRYLSVPSYQIDRGIFENYLAEEAARRGVRFVDGAMVRSIDLADDARQPHRIDLVAGRRDARRRTRAG